ncbi:hypothetical protein L5515_001268 [Caenorhabditis briggsae]|uniref:Uncharacterized protein n=1 Tax=Caenorhabditis briggsae TaxID=6238 RepID=A0AAE9E0Y4_CAEBR|nr:hypothetical protein L5515_001268 [Caenorhabditis briggsae]
MNSENDESSTSTSSSTEGSSGGPPGPSIHAAFVLDQFSNGVEMMRCSMPSLSKMPSAARQLVSNMLSFLSSPSPQNNVSEKGASFSTPQANRKNKVNGSRRMSDSNNVAYSNGKAR